MHTYLRDRPTVKISYYTVYYACVSMNMTLCMYVCMYVCMLCKEMKAVQKAKLAEKQQMLTQLAKMNEDLAASVKHVSEILGTHTYIHTLQIHTYIFTYIHFTSYIY